MKALGRVLGHAILVGVAAGLLAAGFYELLELSQSLLLERLAGVSLPRPLGEPASSGTASGGDTRWWLVVLLPTAGGLACGFVVHFFCPAAAGPGGDQYIAAFHHRRGQIPLRVTFFKGLASLLTLGTGGSVGREGPTMQMASGVASSIARRLKLSDRERRLLVVAGAAAATGAIFQTPLGAAIYAVEVLYRDDFEVDALVPSILASVTAYSIFTSVHGQGHLLVTAESYPFDAWTLPLYAMMAVGLSLSGAVFVKIRHASQDHFFSRLRRVPPWARPALGGLLLGLLALVSPYALGAGYGLAQLTIMSDGWLEPGWWGIAGLLGLAGVKMLSTSFSLGSGGSGGEFGPTLVIGGLVGGAFGAMFHLASPALVPDPGAFALVGMGALIGGVAHVPVSSLIMVCELAGSYDLLVPLMLAEGIAYVLLRKVYLYRCQVPSRLHSPAHRHESRDVLESIEVSEVFDRGARLDRVAPDAKLGDVLERMSESDFPALLVGEPGGPIEGVIAIEAVQASLAEDGLREELDALAIAPDVMVPLAPVEPSDDLHRALHAFLETGSHALPVSSGGEILGVITHDHVTMAYEAELTQRRSLPG